MRQVIVQHDAGAWRREARALLRQGVPPAQVVWAEAGEPTFFDSAAAESTPSVADAPAPAVRVPPEFLTLAETAGHHRDADRWGVLYRVLWRLTHGEPHLLAIDVDDDVHALRAMAKAVRRDVHKMHAFVRFRQVTGGEGADRYVAFHLPDHRIVRLAAPFFRDRFRVLRWAILTPDESAMWDGTDQSFGPGVPQRLAPQADDLEALWKAYYASVFNPARVKVRAMKKEMPVRHWRTLPEAELIDSLLREAPKRVEDMVAKARASSRKSASGLAPGLPGFPPSSASDDKKNPGKPGANPDCESTGSARDFLPAQVALPVLREAVKSCRGCALYCPATQAVFGEGPATASVVFVGEQPGDMEDRAGRPFVGPAGKVLDDALQAAGIYRGEVYVTNTVKHFKFEPRGKRRIHAKPGAREIAACVPWLEAEVAAVKPKLIVALGATAAQALMGRQFRVTKDRGTVFTDTPWAPGVIATTHPSMILRVPDPAAKEQAYADFVADLKTVRKEMDRITRDQAVRSAAKRMAKLQPGQYAAKDLVVPPEADHARVWTPV